MRQQPTTIGLNNQNNQNNQNMHHNSNNFMDGSNLFASLGLDDKIFSPQNYNGPIPTSVLRNNMPSGFYFKQTEPGIESNKSSNFLKKAQKRN